MALVSNVGPRSGKKTIAVSGSGTGGMYTVPAGKEFEGYISSADPSANWAVNGAPLYWAGVNTGTTSPFAAGVPFHVQLVAGDSVSSTNTSGNSRSGSIWGQEFDAQ